MKRDRASLMTVDDFLVWSEDKPGRYELVGGHVLSMSPERIRHTEAKFSASLALFQAIRRANLSCQMLMDGATVRIDRDTAFEPDALVRCGAQLSGDLLEVPDPIVVVDVLSPRTRNYDLSAKSIGYFGVPTIRHYVIIDPDGAKIIHHRRDGDGVATRILGQGNLRLDPPGLDLTVEDMLRAG